MNWKIIKNGDYNVTDDFIKYIEREAEDEGIISPEWDIFCVRFSLLFDDYEDCRDSFWEDVQEELEEYQDIHSVLSMTGKDAYRFLSSVYLEGFREFKVMSRTDEEVCFYGSSNVYLEAEDEDFFTFCDEYEYLFGRRFPPNRYRGKQNELYDRITNEFCGYTGEIIDFIIKSDDMGEQEIFGDIKIRIFSKY